MIGFPITGEDQLDGERVVELMLTTESRLRGGGSCKEGQ